MSGSWEEFFESPKVCLNRCCWGFSCPPQPLFSLLASAPRNQLFGCCRGYVFLFAKWRQVKAGTKWSLRPERCSLKNMCIKSLAENRMHRGIHLQNMFGSFYLKYIRYYRNANRREVENKKNVNNSWLSVIFLWTLRHRLKLFSNFAPTYE